MGKKVKIIIAGAIVYWLATYFLLKFFLAPIKVAPINLAPINTYETIFIVILNAGIPFLLGLIVSILLKGKYDWIYGIITFYIYLIINSLRDLIVFALIYKIDSLFKELYDIKQGYLHTGISASLFVIIGGVVGHYINSKKSLQRKVMAN